MNEVVKGGVVLTNKVDTPETRKSVRFIAIIKKNMPGNFYLPSIAVAGGEAHKAVGQVVVADKRAELTSEVGRVAHSAIPVANDGLCDQCSEVIIVLPADSLDCERDVRSWDGVITNSNFRADEVRDTLLLSCESRSCRSRGLARKSAEVLLG